MQPENVPIYKYIENTSTWSVRLIYLLATAVWVSVLYGYSRIFAINRLYFFLLVPTIAFFTIHFFISYFIIFFYKQPDSKAHLALINNFWRRHAPPPVDVFITICGEDTNVLQKTFFALSKLSYENKKIYVLDDKGIEAHKQLAENFGFIYLSRENKGYMKKAGNIKYGYERSNGDFIVIFDADFAPHPDFIKHLLPYMEDPGVGIVQSPQYFQTDEEIHKRSALEYGASHVQEDFYRYIQVARDRIGAPICCGSNALYRRAALESIGGTTQVEHSEDMQTGFDLMAKGWRVRYVPLILAIGLCPDNLQAYFQQQHRWCSGNIHLLLYKKFWKSNISILQKICFISGFLYYLSYPLVILSSFQIFFFVFWHYNALTLVNALPFIPALVFGFLIVPAFRLSRSRPGGLLARTAHSFFYCQAVIMALVKQSIGWQPTNTKTAGVSHAFRQVVLFNALYLFIYAGLTGIALSKGLLDIFNLNSYFMLFLIFYIIFANAFLLFQLNLVLRASKQQQLATAAIGQSSLRPWRLKTVGLYGTVILLIAVFGLTALPLSVEKIYNISNNPSAESSMNDYFSINNKIA